MGSYCSNEYGLSVWADEKIPEVEEWRWWHDELNILGAIVYLKKIKKESTAMPPWMCPTSSDLGS